MNKGDRDERVDVQGHPQCLRNVMTAGLLPATGISSWLVEGALCPASGGEETLILGGVNHEWSSWVKDIVDLVKMSLIVGRFDG